MGPFLRSLGEHLDDLILVVVFVLLPVLQRVFSYLKKQRAEAERAERARRALETPPDAEPAESHERGGDLWAELLERVDEPAAAEAPAPAPPPAPRSEERRVGKGWR